MSSDRLTPQQRRAVVIRDTSVVLSSGAGCGKTHVLTERYLSHLRDDGAEVGQVVAITFTDRAAREMRGRIRKAVEVWATQANTAALLKILGDFRGPEGEKDACAVIGLLGSLKDPKAAPALAQALTLDRERGPVSKALVSIGPAAEEAVLPYLQGADPDTRIAACWVVGEVGTIRSLQPLQDAISTTPGGPPGDALIWEAQTAMQMIGARK